jgi:hypothetical protein
VVLEVFNPDWMSFPARVEIPSCVESITQREFSGAADLREVIFAKNDSLRRIEGFSNCTSLAQIEIPSSVETIGARAFSGCSSLIESIFAPGSHLKRIHGLGELLFAPDSHLREIDGFMNCILLYRIVIPSSLEILGINAFRSCRSLCEVLFVPDSHLKRIGGFTKCE